MFNNRLTLSSALDHGQSWWLQRETARKIQRQFLAAALAMGEESGEPEQVLASTSVIMELDETVAPSVLHHPSFRYWVQASRRSTSPQFRSFRNEVVANLTSIAWAIDVVGRSSRIEWTVTVDVSAGIRAIPFGFSFKLGEEHARQRVRISSRDGLIRVACMDGSLIAEVESHFDADGCLSIRSLSESLRIFEFDHVFNDEVPVQSIDPWLRVKLTGTNQRRDGTEFFAVDDDIYDPCRRASHVGEAADLIKKVWPAAAEDIGIFTQVIVPIWLPPTKRGAFTVSSRQGAIFIGEGSADEVADMILHENAHVKLRQIQLLDTLLEDPLDETVKVSVPWRPDPRPIPGVIEGLFVFAHVAEFNLRRCLHACLPNDKIARLTRDLETACALVMQHGTLTSEGAAFLKEARAWIQSLIERTPRSRGASPTQLDDPIPDRAHAN